MLDEDLCEYKQKDPKGSLRYYQNRINKVIYDIKTSDKKYTLDDFPMKTNVSIINEDNDLSNIVIDENYSLLRKESEIYIYPTKMKKLLVEKRLEKENIINKKNNLYNDFDLYVSLFTSWFLMFLSGIVMLLLVFHKGDKFIILEVMEAMFSLVTLLALAPEIDSESVKRNEFLVVSFYLSPIKEIFLPIIIIKAIKANIKFDNYSKEEMKSELNEFIKDIPESVRNIVLAEKVSFY